MTDEQIARRLQERFGDRILEYNTAGPTPFCKVSPGAIAAVCEYLRDDPDLRFDSCMCVSGVDYGKDLGVVYHLHSMSKRHKCVLHVDLPREDPHVPTVSHIWSTADWHEREAYDLFGVVFDGHPDLRRILLPDDWEGYPLRKDYVTPEYYNGMRVAFNEEKQGKHGGSWRGEIYLTEEER